jgi:hypothetical protein
MHDDLIDGAKQNSQNFPPLSTPDKSKAEGTRAIPGSLIFEHPPDAKRIKMAETMAVFSVSCLNNPNDVGEKAKSQQPVITKVKSQRGLDSVDVNTLGISGRSLAIANKSQKINENKKLENIM